VRIPRLLSIVGPAAVLYLLAARASSSAAQSPNWLLAAVSLGFALSPLAVVGARLTRRIAELALLGTSLAIAIASAGTSSRLLDSVHDYAWLLAVVLMLDLALPAKTTSLVRRGATVGLTLTAVVSALLSGAELLAPQTTAVVIVAGMLAIAAVHQVALKDRGHPVEGWLAAMVLVILAVWLAYGWFGPVPGSLAIAVEASVALSLWLGHLTWVDARYRSLRPTVMPVALASLVCFALANAWAPSAPLESWKMGAFAIAYGALWSATFALARRVSRRAVWSGSGPLAEAAEAARRALIGATNLETVASAVLMPLLKGAVQGDERPEIWVFEPPLRICTEPGNRTMVRSGEAPPAIVGALTGAGMQSILDLIHLRLRVVREPEIRHLVEVMENRDIGAVVPCVLTDHLEGILCLPVSGRTEPLSASELQRLGSLGQALAGSLASTLAQRRAESHVRQLSELRWNAERRVAALEVEVEQLRDQCDIVGRGLAEDQTLHVAYSPSMRSVQTRAIELAPGDEPILLVAGAGSPVLPVSRFIHDRGPRWESPFVVADCSAVATEEVTSLLFGSQAGRPGWFDSATGGTLLLRDVPALPLVAQSRLAAALHEFLAVGDADEQGRTSVPPRIIATSRSSLATLRGRGALDPGLDRCLSSNILVIPPLRERREDVPSLALLAIDRACRVLARDPVGIEQRAMSSLVDHDWPGDVAELELVIELAVGGASGKTIVASDLPPLAWPTGEPEESLSGTYLEVERRLLERALRRAGGNKSEAARRLGLKRTTFLDKLRRHGLEQRTENDVPGRALG
jgi:DNA-binding NtrC family response regulator